MNPLTNFEKITGYEFAADLVKSQLEGNQERFDHIFSECVNGDPRVAQLALKSIAVVAARSLYALHAGNRQTAADQLDTDIMGTVMQLQNTPESE
ncbi:hypothetical protein [Kocuria sp.]|uniref:hypothetical protein n=1 Tax=Kocuria sp. TaxID=1871328 RepID=UPI0026DFB199|nr:hypothetical protein [Kocuria sp.]MDO5618767.1 hypothetical protein [Kocuria sp.]